MDPRSFGPGNVTELVKYVTSPSSVIGEAQRAVSSLNFQTNISIFFASHATSTSKLLVWRFKRVDRDPMCTRGTPPQENLHMLASLSYSLCLTTEAIMEETVNVSTLQKVKLLSDLISF